MSVVLAPEAQHHAEVVAQFLKKTSAGEQAGAMALARSMSFTDWAEKNYYIPSDDGFAKLIKFLPHQKIIFRLFFDPKVAAALGCADGFQTIVFSTIKNSRKTACAGAVARWISETWGSHSEVFCMANDKEQARGRIYAAALMSIELDPRYNQAAKGIPGLWRIIEREARYVPTHSTVKAVSVDYKGEAGSNPVATLWSELWGFMAESDVRMWEELTPVPTRPRSIRYVETYAGFEGESGILNSLEDRVKKDGRRLTLDELRALVPDIEWPWPDQGDRLPFYIHAPTRTIAYWDEGLDARRMPWQTPQYYQSQTDLRPGQFRRLHFNERVSNVEDFIPKEWWDRLQVELPPLDSNTPLVVGADASVTGDCTGIVAVSRDPNDPSNILHRMSMVWQPSQGRPLDYSATIEPALRDWCSRFNVVEIAYDPYQLHDLMTRLRNEAIAYCRPFSQQSDRMIADKALYDLIRDKRIHHGGDPDLQDHVTNCGAKYPPDDNSRMRLVKKGRESKIDLAVATSMACKEALRLNL